MRDTARVTLGLGDVVELEYEGEKYEGQVRAVGNRGRLTLHFAEPVKNMGQTVILTQELVDEKVTLLKRASDLEGQSPEPQADPQEAAERLQEPPPTQEEPVSEAEEVVPVLETPADHGSGGDQYGISEWGLSQIVTHRLKKLGFKSGEEVARVPDNELLAINGIAAGTIARLRERYPHIKPVPGSTPPPAPPTQGSTPPPGPMPRGQRDAWIEEHREELAQALREKTPTEILQMYGIPKGSLGSLKHRLGVPVSRAKPYRTKRGRRTAPVGQASEKSWLLNRVELTRKFTESVLGLVLITLDHLDGLEKTLDGLEKLRQDIVALRGSIERHRQTMAGVQEGLADTEGLFQKVKGLIEDLPD